MMPPRFVMPYLLLLACFGLCSLPATGQSWSALGGGLGVQGSSVNALAIYDGELYAAGGFSTLASGDTVRSIARWDGAQWQPLPIKPSTWPSAPIIHDLQLYDTMLVAGGDAGFAYPFYGMDWWDGEQWVYDGTGINLATNTVKAVERFQGDLYVGGGFTEFDGISASRIARWNGSSWDNVAGGVWGIFNQVRCMAVYHDELYVGGTFHTAGTTPVYHLAKWDGNQWHDVGGGLWDSPVAMVVDTVADVLYVGGNFNHAGNDTLYTPWVAQWDGTEWSALPGSEFLWGARSMGMYRNQLFVGGIGNVTETDTTLARWDGTQWHPYAGMLGIPYAIMEFDDHLIVGGQFWEIDGQPYNNIARFHLPDSCSYWPTAAFATDSLTVSGTQPVSFAQAAIVTPGDSIVQWQWDFGNGQTATGEVVAHPFHTPGSYPVSLTITNAGGCTSTSTQIVEITTGTGIPDPTEQLAIRVFPNPVSSQRIQVAGTLTSPATFTLYAPSGAVAHQARLSSQRNRHQQTVALPALPGGTYVYRIASNEGATWGKLVLP